MAAPLLKTVYSRCILCGNNPSRLRIRRLRQQRRAYSDEVHQKKSNDTQPINSPNAWQPVIGLEIHAQIKAETKLFSRAAALYGAPVNTQVHFLDMALPGTLPVINRRCVEAGVLTALALNCRINEVSRFDRKHYFYADLPAGYQITQQKHALANDGVFTYILYGRTHFDCVEKKARITQLQLEQDSGKSLHDDVENQSLIDLNRAGCALMEIVTEPDFHTAEEARAFVRDLRRLLMLIGTCDGEMGEGSMRVDANISVHKKGEPLGVRTEMKNLNSLNIVQRSINFEIKRQIKVLERGGQVVNETRSFDKETGQTMPMRDKEVRQDYRFMPEPNLPPLHVFKSAKSAPSNNSPKVIIEDLQQQLPEVPYKLRELLMSEYDCSLFQAGFFVNEGVQEQFMTLAKDWNSKKFRNFFVYHIINNLIMMEVEPDKCQIPLESIETLYKCFFEGDVGQFGITKILELLLKAPAADPQVLLDEHGLRMIKDETVLRQICEQILDSPKAIKAIKKYKNGKTEESMKKLIYLADQVSDQKASSHSLKPIFTELLLERIKN